MIPPIGAVRCQWFFNDGRMEWSETLWRPVGTSLDSAMGAALSLGSFRVNTLGTGVQMTEIRVSKDDVFGDSDVNTDYAGWLGPKGADPRAKIYNSALLGGQAVALPAAPTRCLKVRLEGTTGERWLHRRPIYFSGMPDYVVQDQGPINPEAGQWQKAFDKWGEQLTGSTAVWGFVVYHKPVGAEKFPVAGITRVGSGGDVTVTLTVPPTFAVRDTIELFRPRFNGGSLKIQGKYEVVTIAGNTFTVRPTLLGDVSYRDGGTVWKVTREFATIFKVTPEIFTIHKRGGAELGPRGRLSSRKSFAG